MKRQKMKEWVDELDRLQNKREEMEESEGIGEEVPPDTSTAKYLMDVSSSVIYGTDRLAGTLVRYEDARLDAEYVSELTGTEVEGEPAAHSLLTSEIAGLLREDDTDSIKSIVDDAYEVTN